MANTGHVADRVETDGDRPPFCPRIGSASITEIDEVSGADPFTQSVEPRMGLQFIDGLISPGGRRSWPITRAKNGAVMQCQLLGCTGHKIKASRCSITNSRKIIMGLTDCFGARRITLGAVEIDILQNLKPASLKTARSEASPNTARNLRTGERSRRAFGTTKS